MVEAQGLRKQDRVVRPITAAGGRTCARPGCPAMARSTLVFAYEAKQARLVALTTERDPAAYDLCSTHADRTSPPFGWTLADERPPPDDGRPVDLADEDHTVAVISAALRAVPAPLPVEPDAVDAEEARALADAASEIAGVEVALAELDEVAATRTPAPVEPEVWVAPVEDARAALTLPFGEPRDPAPGALDPVEPSDEDAPELDDEEFDDAPFSEDGAAQLW